METHQTSIYTELVTLLSNTQPPVIHLWGLNPCQGNQRIHHVFMAGESVIQLRHRVLLHVSCMLTPAVNKWRILYVPVWGLGVAAPHV